MNDVEKMTADEFARWWYKDANSTGPTFAEALARRDAYRERQALEAAADRGVKELVLQRYGNDFSATKLEAAILGAPRFVKGQLVRWQGSCSGEYWYGPFHNREEFGKYEREHLEPVTVRIDAEGRAIVVEEEA